MSAERDVYVSNSAITTVPGGSATVVAWDSTADPGLGTTLARRRAFPQLKRATIIFRADQQVTFKHNTLNKQSTTWRTENGSGSGDILAASTDYEFDVFLFGEDNQLVFVTGTAPTVWEVSIRLSTDRATAQ